VYVSGVEGAELLGEAVERQAGRAASKRPLNKVSNSRLKYLQKRDNFTSGAGESTQGLGIMSWRCI
jgi:hypothetical protein